MILAFVEDRELILGLLEYFRQETDRLSAVNTQPAFVQTCSQCPNQNLEHRGPRWNCGECGASGWEDDAALRCPECGAVAVKNKGGGIVCNHCGHQWGVEKAQAPFTRRDALKKFGR